MMTMPAQLYLVDFYPYDQLKQKIIILGNAQDFQIILTGMDWARCCIDGVAIKNPPLWG